MADNTTPRGERPPRNIATRVMAAMALVVCAVAVLLVVNGTMSSEDGNDAPAQERAQKKRPGERPPEDYVVQEGETATGIGQRFNVRLNRLQKLNPDTDFQTLNAGEVLKLR